MKRTHTLSVFGMLAVAIVVCLFPTGCRREPTNKAARMLNIWTMHVNDGVERLHSQAIEVDIGQDSPQGVLDLLHAQYMPAAHRFERVEAAGDLPAVQDYIMSGEMAYYPSVLLVREGVAWVCFRGDFTQPTTRMGTAGARAEEAQIVYNLTEFPNIERVFFVDEGDHLTQGFRTRAMYTNMLAPSVIALDDSP